MTRPRRWVCGVVAVAAVCTGLAASPWPAAEAVGAVPLVLYLPGSALVAAVDPWATRARGLDRVFWSGSASIGAAVLGGFLLNAAGGLRRGSWLLLLVALVAVGSGVGWLRGGRRRDRVPAEVRRRRRRPISPGTGLLLVGATALVAGALGLSVVASIRLDQEHFVQLWLVPRPRAAGAYAGSVRVGMRNDEGRTVALDLQVRTASATLLRRRRLRLRPGQTWSVVVRRPGQLAVTATVSLASRPSRVLLLTRLAAPFP